MVLELLNLQDLSFFVGDVLLMGRCEIVDVILLGVFVGSEVDVHLANRRVLLRKLWLYLFSEI